MDSAIGQFAAALPNTLLGWVGLLSLLALAVVTWRNKAASLNAQANEDLVNTLLKKVNILEQSLKETIAKLEKVTAENELLKQLTLQRTPEDDKLREQVTVALNQISVIYEAHMARAKRSRKSL